MNKWVLATIFFILCFCNSFGQTQSEVFEKNQQLDSIVEYNYDGVDSVRSEKYIYKYDANGTPTQMIWYLWDSKFNVWVCMNPDIEKHCQYQFGDKKHTVLIKNVYTESGNLTRYYYENISGNWVPTNKVDYEFDLNGYQTLEANYVWDSDLNGWVVYSLGYGKNKKSYDENGNIIVEFFYKSSTNLKAWVADVKNEYTYDSDGNQTLCASYLWRSGWIGQFKYEYEFDSSGYKILEVYYRWKTEINDWIGKEKQEWYYDSEGQQILKARYNWDSNLNEWIKIFEYKYKHEYNYDDAGNIILDIRYRWDIELKDWELFSKYKYEFEYDTYGDTTLEASYRWDFKLNDWKVVSKSKYENDFDEYGNQIFEASYEWDLDLDNWKVVSMNKYEYEYDESGNQTQFVNIEWNKRLNDWITVQKQEWDHDSAGNLILDARYVWNSGLKDFIGTEKTEWSFDAFGNLIYNATYKWDKRFNNWGGNWKYEYEYDAFGNLNHEIYYEWDSYVSDWVCISPYIGHNIKYRYGNAERSVMIENIYDTSGKLSLELHYSWISDYWVLTGLHEPGFDTHGKRTIDSVYTWNSVLNEWAFSSKSFYYYSNHYTGLNQLKKEDIIIFPNPTSGTINISSPDYFTAVNVYDIKGQLLKTFQQVSNLIDLSEFKTGIYILKFLSKDKMMIQKVIKE